VNDTERNDDDPRNESAGDERQTGTTAAEQEIQRLQDEKQQLEQQLQRAMADAANVRRRQQKEMEDSRRRVLEGLTQELLPVLDSFTLALQAYEKQASDNRPKQDDGADTGDVKGLVDGVRMVKSLLSGALERHGLREIEASGKFDPSRHEAVGVEPSSDVPEGHIVRVLQTGYLLHDHVVRHSKVLVAGPQKPPAGSDG
jgi:molecular chaperone GrpE